MRNLIFVLFAAVMLYSCSDFHQEDVKSNSDDLINREECSGLATYNYLGEDSKYVDLGLAHNMMLDDIIPLLEVSSCDVNEIEFMINQLDELVNLNSYYMEVFLNFNSNDLDVMNDYVNDHIDFCVLDTKSENIDAHEIFLTHLLNECISLEIFSSTELSLLEELSADMMLNGGAPFDLSAYFEQILNNEQSFYNNGEFILSILAIYDYSSCFWENYEFDEDSGFAGNEIDTRWFFARALGDAAGAYTAGVANLIRTNGQYDANDGLFDSMGRGAVGSSSFGASEIIRAIWD